jgi:hypothetical protein
MMNGKVLEWELDETGFADFDAQAVRAAVDRWERNRFGDKQRERFKFKFGKVVQYAKRNTSKGN